MAFLTIFQRLIGYFEQNPLLRIHDLGLVWGYGEEGSIEMPKIPFQEISAIRVGLNKSESIQRPHMTVSPTKPLLWLSGR